MKSEVTLREALASNLNHMRNRGLEFRAKQNVDYPSMIDKPAMEKIKTSIPRYIEVQHQAKVDEIKDNYVSL